MISLTPNLVVSESIKAMFAVIGSHTTGSDSTEGKFLDSKMHDGVVDTETSAGRVLGKQVHYPVPGSKHVQGQGFVSTVDNFDCLLC